jgi:hypothetical protein
MDVHDEDLGLPPRRRRPQLEHEDGPEPEPEPLDEQPAGWNADGSSRFRMVLRARR